MKISAHPKQKIQFSILLVLLSVFFYFIHFAVFRDFHHIMLYLVGDIAFLPIDVLIVIVIIERILTSREKRQMLQKLNMVIGAFFSEVGSELLKFFNEADVHSGQIAKHLIVDQQWSPEHFTKVEKAIEGHQFKFDMESVDIEKLKDFLAKRRAFLLRLLENPNLLEHEQFTEVLWAVFHLSEELSHREDVHHLPKADLEHLAGDISRVARLLVREWVAHMEHLKKDYPYLFSLAVRTNPFNPNASVVLS